MMRICILIFLVRKGEICAFLPPCQPASQASVFNMRRVEPFFLSHPLPSFSACIYKMGICNIQVKGKH